MSLQSLTSLQYTSTLKALASKLLKYWANALKIHMPSASVSNKANPSETTGLVTHRPGSGLPNLVKL